MLLFVQQATLCSEYSEELKLQTPHQKIFEGDRCAREFLECSQLSHALS
jgi:hypothetical protein